MDFENEELDSGDALDAVDVFVNRGAERKEFHAALKRHAEASARGENDPSSRGPRKHVTVFFGAGGYGKSKLSERLEEDLVPEQEAGNRSLATARVRLDSGWDFETMLLAIRAGLRSQGPFPAFDVVTSRYWEQRGLEPRSAVLENKLLDRIAGAVDLPDQFSASMQEVASALVGVSVPGSTVASLLGTIFKYGRSKRRQRTLIDDCPDFLKLFENAGAEGAISHFPKLLAWELWRRKIDLVVFLDEFEVLRQNEHLEKYLNRLIWLMPNAFFLITGRDRLDWGEDDCPRTLPQIGSRKWLGLARGATEDPRQHLVDELSDEDAELFLRGKVLVAGADGGEPEPAISSELRRVIVENAKGWPLYLDLAVGLFTELTDHGDEPSAADFEPGLDRLVTRVARDLSDREREVLRAMALLEGFDLELVAAIAGEPEGVAAGVEQRALVRSDPEGFWPLYLSDPVRKCIRNASTWEGSWTENDWRAGAERALSELGRRFERSRRDRDRQTLINYLNDGIRLAHDFDLETAWLSDAAHDYVADFVWEPTLAPEVPPVEKAEHITTAAHALGLALISIRSRQETHRATTRSELEICIDSGQLSGDARDLVAYFRAECLRDLGEAENARTAMQALIGPRRSMNLQATEGLIYTHRRNGLFATAQSVLADLPESALRWRLQGDLDWNHGRFGDAAESYAKSCDLAEEQGLSGQHAEAEASRAFALGFEGGRPAAESVERARELLKRARIAWGDLQTDNAELLLAAGTEADVGDRAAEAMRAGEGAGLSSITAYAALAAAFDAALQDDPERLAEARQVVFSLVGGRHFRYLLEIIDFWTEDADAGSDGEEAAEWIGDIHDVAARWRRVLADRRERSNVVG